MPETNHAKKKKKKKKKATCLLEVLEHLDDSIGLYVDESDAARVLVEEGIDLEDLKGYFRCRLFREKYDVECDGKIIMR